jgi:hypothetical protein
MARLHRVRFVVIVLALLFVSSLVVACGGDKGPEAEIQKLRVLVTGRWPETLSFRGLDFKGKEYDVFITDKTIINSGTTEEFKFASIMLGDELDLWLNKLPKSPEPVPPQYEAVQINIAPTTR